MRSCKKKHPSGHRSYMFWDMLGKFLFIINIRNKVNKYVNKYTYRNHFINLKKVTVWIRWTTLLSRRPVRYCPILTIIFSGSCRSLQRKNSYISNIGLKIGSFSISNKNLKYEYPFLPQIHYFTSRNTQALILWKK